MKRRTGRGLAAWRANIVGQKLIMINYLIWPPTWSSIMLLLFFATGTITSAQAAKAATKTIAIVFANGGDPIRDGHVTSLDQAGGSLAGVTFFSGPGFLIIGIATGNEQFR